MFPVNLSNLRPLTHDFKASADNSDAISKIILAQRIETLRSFQDHLTKIFTQLPAAPAQRSL